MDTELLAPPAIFSPSQTSTWIRCPMLRALRQEGWVSKYIIKRDLAAIIGTCLAAGLGVYNNLRKEHEAQGLVLDKKKAAAASMGTAFSVLASEMERLEASKRIIQMDDDFYITAMRDRIGKGLSKYIDKEPIPPSWRVVDVERAFPDHGNARPDLVVRDDLGLAIIDWKSKVELKPYYKTKTLLEYSNSFQQYHYAWAGEQVYGEPIHRYYIGLLVIEPFSIDLVPYEINPETLALWRQSSGQVWADMAAEDRGERLPWLSDKHADNFGPCDYYDACFNYRFDPDLMTQKYINTRES